MIYSIIHVCYPVSTNLLRLAHCTFKPPRFKLQSNMHMPSPEMIISPTSFYSHKSPTIFIHDISPLVT